MPIISGASSGSIRPFGFTYGGKPVWVDTTLAPFRYFDAYSDGVVASGTAPITYSIVGGSLPSGLTLNQNTGVISGATTAPGTYNFTIQARNHLGVITQAFTNSVPLAPVAPTFVGQNTITGGGFGPISFTMPTRQAGDIAIVSLHGWHLGQYANQPQKPPPPGWTQVWEGAARASVINEDQTGYLTYIIRSGYYRTMTNTSADNFTYTFPDNQLVDAYVAQLLVVRPAPGMTFTASGNYVGGQTGQAFFGTPIPPTNSWQRLALFSANSLPKTIVSTFDTLGMLYSGPSFVVGTAGPFVPSGFASIFMSSVSNQTGMVRTRSGGDTTYTGAYITGFIDPSANVAAVGTLSRREGNANYWYNNSTTILTWNRA